MRQHLALDAPQRMLFLAMRRQIARLLEGGAAHITIETSLLAVYHTMKLHPRLVLKLLPTSSVIADVQSLTVVRRDSTAGAGRCAI